MAILIRHFDHPRQAEEVVEALQDAGISKEKIGLLTREGIKGEFRLPQEANPDDMTGREGAALGTLAGIVTGLSALASPLGPLIVAGPLFGTLAGALAGAATGGVVAHLVKVGVDEKVAHRMAESLENENALLLSVEVPDERVEEIHPILRGSTPLEEDRTYFQLQRSAYPDLGPDEYHVACEYGFCAAATDVRDFEEAEEEIRRTYGEKYERHRDAIELGFRRYQDTVQVLYTNDLL